LLDVYFRLVDVDVDVDGKLSSVRIDAKQRLQLVVHVRAPPMGRLALIAASLPILAEDLCIKEGSIVGYVYCLFELLQQEILFSWCQYQFFFCGRAANEKMRTYLLLSSTDDGSDVGSHLVPAF
jgi:hypothetical protein